MDHAVRQKILEHTNSKFPLHDFLNDIDAISAMQEIGLISGEKFNIEAMYNDIEQIFNVFMYYKMEYKHLKKENLELRKAVKSWNENGGKLIKENTKLKIALDILKRLVGVNSIVIFPKERVVDITQEEFELLKEVLE